MSGPEQYFVGKVSSIFGPNRGKFTGGSLSDLFTNKQKKNPDVVRSEPVEKVQAKCTASRNNGIAVQRDAEAAQRVSKKSLKKDTTECTETCQEPGFDPPKGIVHESLKSSNKSKSSPTKKTRKKSKDDPLKSERTIFIGNLPSTITKKDLKKMFMKYGEIESMRFRGAVGTDPKIPKRVAVITHEFHPNKTNINAYIVYGTSESAAKALKRNGKLIDGFHIRVDLASNDGKHDHRRSIFIGGLPFDIEEDSIYEHFSACGRIDYVRLIRDNRTGLGKGFGYVVFKASETVSLALKLNDCELDGRKIRVKKAAKKEKRAKKTLVKKRKTRGVTERSEKHRKKTFSKPSNLKFQKQTVGNKKDKKKQNKRTTKKKV